MRKLKIKLGVILSITIIFVITAVTYSITVKNEKIENNSPIQSVSDIVSQSNSDSNTNLSDNNSESDSISILNENKHFKENGFNCKEYSENTKISKKEAIELAKTYSGELQLKKATKVTAVKAKFTDNKITKLPNSNISLRDYPVWIVTFYGVEIPRRDESIIIADRNIVIDCNTGDELESFMYPHN